MYLTSRVQLHIHLLNVVVRMIFFLSSENLICRGTDISKCFRESLGIRDNESRLYMNILYAPVTLTLLSSEQNCSRRHVLVCLFCFVFVFLFFVFIFLVLCVCVLFYFFLRNRRMAIGY